MKEVPIILVFLALLPAPKQMASHLKFSFNRFTAPKKIPFQENLFTNAVFLQGIIAVPCFSGGVNQEKNVTEIANDVSSIPMKKLKISSFRKNWQN